MADPDSTVSASDAGADEGHSDRGRAGASAPHDPRPSRDARDEARSSGAPALAFVSLLPWLAGAGILALVVGKLFAPALPGVSVGVGKYVRSVEIAGGALSQAFAWLSVLAIGRAIFTSLKIEISLPIRLLVFAGSGWVALGILGAYTDRVPDGASLLGAGVAGIVAITSALVALQRSSHGASVLRWPAVALMLVGLGALARSIVGWGVIFSNALSGSGDAAASSWARTGTTIAIALSGAATVLLLIVAGQGFRSAAVRSASEGQGTGEGGPPVASLATIVVLVLAGLAMSQAMSGARDDAGTTAIILKRMSDRFLGLPEPYLRLPVRLFLGFLTPLTAAALLTVRRVGKVAAAAALVLVGADAPHTPLGALALVVASWGVLLPSRDPKAFWSALRGGSPGAERAGT